MATLEMTFTKGALDKAAHTGGAATRYRDSRYPDLYLEVGAQSKTWRFRKFWKGQNFREKRGRAIGLGAGWVCRSAIRHEGRAGRGALAALADVG